MGSRAVVVVCRDEEAARRAVRRRDGEGGHRATRAPGGASSTTPALEAAVPRPGARRRSTAAGFWDELETDWVCLDCELMPWSAKAQELLRQQYAAGRRGRPRAALAAAVARARRGRRRAASTSASCWRASTASGATLAERYVDGLPPLLLAGRRRSTT